MEWFFEIGLVHYLGLSIILFLIGIIGVLISRNLLRIVMSLFILTVSVVLNFTAVGMFLDTTLGNSNLISFFILIISVLQAIIAGVIMYKIYRANEYLDSEKTKDKEE